ncbi:hypothetical protein V6N11_036754 [Hibiscus sabdariffa]|uniref:Reverse transcriptase zinc-binding domain-containing protein n=1 Tax=Hibiscus sabdariffa TaxID=183260 RepID=A0ABR2RBB7_9ROSI
MVDDAGSWDWARLSQWLPHATLEKIAAVKPPQIGAGTDVPGWRWEKNRNFSVKSAYKLLDIAAPLNVHTSWAKIWKLPVPPRIRVFLWIAFHQRLLTNIERVRRHISSTEMCSTCQDTPESIDHVLRLCPKARHIWEAIVDQRNIHEFLSIPFSRWISQCVQDSARFGQGDAIWNTRFVVFCWLIWKRRCNEIFDNNPLHESALIRYGIQLAKDFDSVHIGVKNLRISQPAAWCPPPHGWMKANCDGAVNTKDGRAAIGGMIRDEYGSWKLGFTRNIGSLEATKIINRSSLSLVNTLLVEDILKLIARPWIVHIRHINRSKNKVADTLAALSRDKAIDEEIFEKPPNEVMIELNRDMIG